MGKRKNNIVFFRGHNSIPELIVRRMIQSGRWERGNITLAQVEKFAEEFACFAKARGESGHQLINTLDAYLNL